MNPKKLILLDTLCSHFKVEMAFFSNLNEMGLIEIQTIEKLEYIHEDTLFEMEKIIRMYQELDINLEGIDIVFNLLQKIENLQLELISIKTRLRLYEN